MAQQPICRIGDTVTGTCNANAPGHPRTFTGTWQTGSTVVKIDGLGVVRVGDSGTTDCNHNFTATTGSTVADDNGIKLHRVGDTVTVTEGGSGTSQTGSPSTGTI